MPILNLCNVNVRINGGILVVPIKLYMYTLKHKLYRIVV